MSRWGDAAFVLFILAIIYVLVRPQSAAGQAVESVGDLLVALVERATDLAT